MSPNQFRKAPVCPQEQRSFTLFTVSVQAASTGPALPEKAVRAGAAALQAVEEGTELVLAGSRSCP